MNARKGVFLGAALLFIGLLALFARFSGENLALVFLPFVLIAFGLLFLVSPNLIPANSNQTVKFIGEYRPNYLSDHMHDTIYMGIGDVDLDFSHMDLPEGDTVVRIICFAAGIRLKFNQNTAYKINSNAFVSEVHAADCKEEFVVSPCEYKSKPYSSCDRRIKVEILSFVSDISIL
jgi:predicted membrane protein